MKIIVERDPFAVAVAAATRTAEKADTHPILNHVLLKPNGREIGFVGTNLDMQTEASAPAEITANGGTNGPIAVLAAPLTGLIGRLATGAQVTLEWNEPAAGVTVKAGRSRYNLKALPASDFPGFPEVDNAASFSLQCNVFSDVLKSLQFAISAEKTRFYLAGIYMHVGDDTHSAFGGKRDKCLSFCATDGSNLARARLPLPPIKGELTAPIIPGTTIAALLRLLHDDEGSVDIAISQSLARFTTGSTVLTSKLIDGTFPDYVRVIPADTKQTMIVDCKDLEQALERLSLVGDGIMKCDLSDGLAKLTLASSAVGNAEEEIAIEWQGEPFTIGMSARRLLEILSSMKADQCVAKFTDHLSPVLIQPWRAGVVDTSRTFVTMPMGYK